MLGGSGEGLGRVFGKFIPLMRTGLWGFGVKMGQARGKVRI